MIASALASSLFGWRRIPTKFCQRRVNNQVTRASHFETKINICESAGELFVESADLLKNFAAHQQACAGDRAVVAGHLQLTVHARMLRRETAKSGLRNSVHAKTRPACSIVPLGLINRAPTAPTSGRCTCSAMIVSQSGPIASTLSSRKRSHGLSVCATA